MANKYGSNYTAAYNDVPRGRPNVGEFGGVVKALFDQLASPVAADVAYMGKLPKGARVLSVSTIGAGSGATVNVAAADSITSETDVTVTIGTSPGATLTLIVMYVVD